MLQRLHEVGLERVLEQRRHRARHLEVARRNRLFVVGVAHDDAPKARLEVRDVGGKAQHRHDLARDRDVVAVLSRGAVDTPAETIHEEAKLTVVHIDAALPRDPAWVYGKRVALIDMVIQHRREQVVGGSDRVKISRKVEVDVLHWHDLRHAAAGCPALHAEHGPKRRLAKRNHRALADLAKAIREAHRGGGLAFTRGRRRDRGHEDQLAVGLVTQVAEQVIVDLRLVSAVLLDIALVDLQRAGNFRNRLH